MKSKKWLMTVVLISAALTLGSCAKIRDTFKQLKGELIGNEFTVMMYDNSGNKVSQFAGKRIEVSTFSEKSFLDSLRSSEEDQAEASTSVIDITIDGRQVIQVGNTVLFAEQGLELITDFSDVENIDSESNGGTGWMPLDRFINEWANKIGKAKTVVISSQLGVPIGIYQGDSVYVTIPDDLPKTTRLNIDGKSLYIHRANYQIIDSSLLK